MMQFECASDENAVVHFNMHARGKMVEKCWLISNLLERRQRIDQRSVYAFDFS